MKPKRIIALVLALFMVLALTGCLGHFYDKAGDINGVEISSGLYLMAEYSAYQEARSKREDTEKSVFSQKIEDQSANDWIRARTEELLRRYVCVRALCREYDLSVDYDNTAQTNLNEMMQLYGMMSEAYTERGISQETYLRYQVAVELGSMLFSYLYSEGGLLAVDDEQLKTEYAQQYAYLKAISIPLSSGADGVDVRDEVIELADAMVQKLRAGEATLETLTETDVAEAYKLLERDYDPSTGVDSIYNPYVKYDQAEGGTYTLDSLERVKNAAVGDFGLLLTGSSVVVYEKLPMFGDDAEFTAKRSEVLRTLKQGEYEDYLRSIYSEYPVNWVFGAQWYLSPKKVANE